MKMAPHNEVHICFADSGHRDSVDCWCEPARIYWYTNPLNIRMLVVEHADDARIHRLVRIAARERDKDLPFVPANDFGLDQPWITRALDRVPDTGAKGPSDGHE
jgi:hypothetical protein